jgi:hypothetical protein
MALIVAMVVADMVPVAVAKPALVAELAWKPYDGVHNFGRLESASRVFWESQGSV